MKTTTTRRYNVAGILFVIVLALGLPSQCAAQWRFLVVDDPSCAIYFLDLPGPPRIGFVSQDGSGILKTTDGGWTWKTVGGWGATDYTFKDSMTGWANCGNIFMTTDGGDSWQPNSLNGGAANWAIYYDSSSDGLFATRIDYGQWISWDEGLTWSEWNPNNRVEMAYCLGYSFCDGDTGIVTQGAFYNDTEPTSYWSRTTDGGHTWNFITMDSDCFQPLAIWGTKTFFAINSYLGFVYRTDDAWNTWKTIYKFPLALSGPFPNTNTGCIRGDMQHLFVQMNDGVYMSTDTGLSWKYLCGVRRVPWGYGEYDRFYVKYPYVYANSVDTVDGGLNMLNVDSMQYFGTGIAFPDGSKRTTVDTIRNDVTINFSANQDQIGIDSGHIVIHFNSDALGLKSLLLPPSWVIVDSSSRNGILDLRTTADSNAALPSPIITLTFNTYLSSLSTKVYLDSAHLYGKRLNCDCAALSSANSDSVELDFNLGCTDSLILAAMQGQPPFSIVSIQPNPAQKGIAVGVRGLGSGVLDIEMLDILGQTILTQHSASAAADTQHLLSTQNLDVSYLPSGIYFLRLSQNGYVRSRSIAIER